MDSHFRTGFLNGCVAGIAFQAVWWPGFALIGRAIAESSLMNHMSPLVAGGCAGMFISVVAYPIAQSVADLLAPTKPRQSSCQFESRTNTVRAQNEK